MVAVLDRHHKQLMPCTEKRARLLLTKKRAVIHKMAPFTIRMKDRLLENSTLQPLRLKLDPGSKTTGFAVLREVSDNEAVAVILGEIHHKPGIKQNLDSRRALRRGRRNRHTRYRKPRFLNRTRPAGWLPQSLEARVNQTMNTVTKLRKLLPITSASTEHVKFDTQLLQNADIQGVEYQQGTLLGYEVKEYLLERDKRTCCYCDGLSLDPVLEIEHKIPKSRGGSNSIKNLLMACRTCNNDGNDAKGSMTTDEWLAMLKSLNGPNKLNQKRIANLVEIIKNKVVSLKDAAMMNATRWKLFNRLKETGLPVECGTGARTKKQRIEHGLPKEHYNDACCVGESTPGHLEITTQYVEIWSAKGRGTRQMCKTDKFGFPISHRTRQKQFCGFQTGDTVKANISKGKYAGTWVGRVAIRASCYFDIKNGSGERVCQGVSFKYMSMLQRNNGWQHEKRYLNAS